MCRCLCMQAEVAITFLHRSCCGCVCCVVPAVSCVTYASRPVIRASLCSLAAHSRAFVTALSSVSAAHRAPSARAVKGRKEPFRFDSFRFRTSESSSVRFGSVRKIEFPGSKRFGCAFRTRRGSVRFGSVRFRVPFRPVPKLNGSVRFGRFGSAGSVRLFIPSCKGLVRRVALDYGGSQHKPADVRARLPGLRHIGASALSYMI